MLRIGISIGTSLPRDHRGGPDLVVEQARAARRAGLDTLSVGDHHATGPAPYLQNAPMLGRLLAEWDDRPAGCLFLVPLWNPVLMAEQIATLAAIAAGPFIIQTGLGGGFRQFRGMGVDLADRVLRLEEGVRVVQALLTGETADSAVWGIEKASIAPLPSRGVEWWVGAGAPRGIDRAARVGDCWYANADLTPDRAREAIDRYREACARHDRHPVRIPIRRDVLIADRAADAEEVGDALIEGGYRGFERSAVTYGDPAQVAEQLAAYGEMGFTDIIIRTMTAEPTTAVRTVELAGEVRTRLR